MPSLISTRSTLPLSRLKEMDIELMRRLSPRANVIPVIGRSDSLTPRELKAFKKRVRFRCPPSLTLQTIFGIASLTAVPRQIMEDIEYYNIPIYNFPYDEDEDDQETINENVELRVRDIGSPCTLVSCHELYGFFV